SPADYPGISGETLARAAADAGGGRTVVWAPDYDAAERYLFSHLREGDLCVTMGGEPIAELAERLVAGGISDGVREATREPPPGRGALSLCRTEPGFGLGGLGLCLEHAAGVLRVGLALDVALAHEPQGDHRSGD